MSDTATKKKFVDPEVPIGRLQFIVDAVFAISLVSFAIIFPWPEVDKTAANPLLKLLSAEAENFISLGLIYSIIAMYWYKHTVQFRYLQRINTAQVILQLTYMFGVVTLPYTVWLTLALGDHTLSYILHNINLIWLGFFSIMAWNHATKGNRLVDKDMPVEVARSVRRAALIEPIVMVIGIFAALVGSLWWMLSFLLLFIVPMVGKAFKKK